MGPILIPGFGYTNETIINLLPVSNNHKQSMSVYESLSNISIVITSPLIRTSNPMQSVRSKVMLLPMGLRVDI